MKMISLTRLLLAVLASSASLLAAEKIVAGPNGGRLLAAEPHRAEFLVTQDRHVEILFHDATLKPLAPGGQVVAVIVEKDGRLPLELVRREDRFVSTTSLPEGEPYRVVVQIRAEAGARPQNFRVNLNTAECGECSLAEYACTCEAH